MILIDIVTGSMSLKRICVFISFISLSLVLPTFADASLEVLQSPVLTTTGSHALVAIAVRFQDQASSAPTSAEITPLLQKINEFYDESSYHKLQIVGTKIVGPYTLPLTVGNGCPDYNKIAEEAVKKADPEVYFPDYRHVVIFFPYEQTCRAFTNNGLFTYSGISLGPIPSSDTTDGPSSTKRVLINGKQFPWNNIAHELGHNLGLSHASALGCGSLIIDQYECGAYGDLRDNYKDNFDTMGNGFSGGHFNTYYKERLAWLESQNIRTLDSVADSGTYTIRPHESASTGIQQLKISLGRNRYYVLEYRQPIGFDNLSMYSEPIPQAAAQNMDGLQIRYRTDTVMTNNTFLLDMTPHSTTYDFTDSRLQIGRTFTDGRVAITPLNRDSAGITVRIEILDLTPPAPPTSLRAVPKRDYPIGSHVELSWNASLDAYSYEILRRDDARPYKVVGFSTTPSFNYTPDFGGLFLYAVRAIDAAGNISTESMPPALASPGYKPLIPQQTIVEAQDIQSVRYRIDQLRNIAGLSMYSWADKWAPDYEIMTIKASHFTELRSKLNETLTTLGILPLPVYTNQNLKGQTIRAVDLEEIQKALNPIQ